MDQQASTQGGPSLTLTTLLNTDIQKIMQKNCTNQLIAVDRHATSTSQPDMNETISVILIISSLVKFSMDEMLYGTIRQQHHGKIDQAHHGRMTHSDVKSMLTLEILRYAIASSAVGLRILAYASPVAELASQTVFKGFESYDDIACLNLIHDRIMTPETCSDNWVGQIIRHLFDGYGQTMTAIDFYDKISEISGMTQEERMHSMGQLHFYAAFYLFTMYEWYGVIPLISGFWEDRPILHIPTQKMKSCNLQKNIHI